MSANGANGSDVDEGLYSRQLYVFGHDAQRKMGASNVLIAGLGGLGVEIAKNVILAGVKSVGLLDNTETRINDLASQFYLTEGDVGKPRAAACHSKLATLNKYVKTYVVDEQLTEDLLSKGDFQVLVLSERHPREVELSEFCHKNGIKFIAAAACGVTGRLFVDVGEDHEVTDKNGERAQRGLISNISKANPGVVMCGETRHNLEQGDWVTFEEVQGMTELNDSQPRQIKVIDPYQFSIEDTTGYSDYKADGYFQQVKVPFKISHRSWSEAAKALGETVYFDVYMRGPTLHCMFEGLSAFEKAHGRLPDPTSSEDADAVAKLAGEYGASREEKVEVDAEFVRRVARPAAATIGPVCAFLGGLAGQEVLKACTGKFTPLNQFYYFEASSSLPDENTDASEFKANGDRYDDIVAVFGRSVHSKMQQLRLFLVGAGAIGCEMLKNWALMGVATASEGSVHVTDMDRIERSNLNRQFLFRDKHVDKLKSESAAVAAREMNPTLNIDAAANKVGKDTEEVYDQRFWDGLSMVVTALDNVEARRYVDDKCLFHGKAMIDSGTLGTKGNTQVVVPHKTINYGATQDPAEEGIPLCTLKHFPNRIEHTIQWARDLFEGAFTQGPQEANNYLSKPDYLDEVKTHSSPLQSLETVKRYLMDEKPLTFDACIVWARLHFETEFNHKIRQLLTVFPPDSQTREGKPFWSGAKRAPQPLEFDVSDPLHMQYVIAAANLRAFNYGLVGSRDTAHFRKVLDGVVVPEFKAKKIRVATTDEEAKKIAEEEAKGDDDAGNRMSEIVQELPSPSSLAGYRLNPVEFEKDDDANFHMDFITACSNCRARIYRIKEEGKHQTKFIAGKIIPAIATTTALVTGLVCLEMYKVAQDKPFEAFHNTYVNLALPLVAQSEPQELTYVKGVNKNGEWKFSAWDKVLVDLGPDCTLGQIIDYLQNEYGLETSMVSYGPALLYYTWAPKKAAERSKMRLVDLIKEVTKAPLSDKEFLVRLEIIVAFNDEDTEIPTVVIRR